MPFNLDQVNLAADYWLAELVSHSPTLKPIFKKDYLGEEVYQYIRQRKQQEKEPDKNRTNRDSVNFRDPENDAYLISKLTEKLQEIVNKEKRRSKHAPLAEMALKFRDIFEQKLTNSILSEQGFRSSLKRQLRYFPISPSTMNDEFSDPAALVLIESLEEAGFKSIMFEGKKKEKIPDDKEEITLDEVAWANVEEMELSPLPSEHLGSKKFMYLRENGGIDGHEPGTYTVVRPVPNDDRFPCHVPAEPTANGFDGESLAQLMCRLPNFQGEKSAQSSN